MTFYLIKLIISLILILAISEIGKQNTFFSALLASLPIISIISIIWIYIDTNNIEKIINFSHNILWLIIPSLIFFITLPILLKIEIKFIFSLFISIFFTVLSYYILILILQKFKINI